MSARNALAVLATLALLPFSASRAEVAEGYEEMPEVIRFLDAGYEDPVFIAASRILDSSGSVDSELIGTYTTHITRILSLAEERGCADVYTSVENELLKARRQNLDIALGNSDNVLIGTVTGLTHGFMDSRAGTLLRIETDEVLAGAPLQPDNYVFFPVGRFQVGSAKICKTNPYYPELPVLKDQVLLMFDDHWFNDSGILTTGGSTGVVTLKEEGISVSRLYQHTDLDLFNKGKSAFIARVREKMSKKKGGEK